MLEQTWLQICREYKPKKERFLLVDVYAALMLHKGNVSPREVILHGIIHANGTYDRSHMIRISKAGKVLDALCWLRQRFPNLLEKDFDLEAVPSHLRHSKDVYKIYTRFVASVKVWLTAWSMVV